MSDKKIMKQEYMERMSDNDLARYLLDYARHRDGEIAAHVKPISCMNDQTKSTM